MRLAGAPLLALALAPALALGQAPPAPPAEPAAPAAAPPAAAAPRAPPPAAPPAAAPPATAAPATTAPPPTDDPGALGDEVRALQGRVRTLEARVAKLEKPPPEPGPTGLFPDLLFGPKVTFLGLPAPFAIGAEVKALDVLGASFDWAFLPTIGRSTSVGYRSWNLALKGYPVHGAFTAGILLGGYEFTLKRSDGGREGKATVSSTYLGPQVGWRWIRPSGFFTGLDVAWAIPVRFSTRVDAPADASDSLRSDLGNVKDKADEYLKAGIPLLGLVQLGWFF